MKTISIRKIGLVATLFMVAAPIAAEGGTTIRDHRGGLQSNAPTASRLQRRLTWTSTLTKPECKGLGGKVTTTVKCSKLGQETCATVNSDGVINVACIDEKVAQDTLIGDEPEKN
ncbi:hypothetical protein [Oricola sp.]|uniref:hypothetical protein n=1 Tax=Oricola sp. TaxID=1979950 RepID=UPI0025E3E19C|nr:hypothetical protein [Oricola sp.]MCI5078181.1 hypothetical protein [Oricola sp.]